MGFLTEMGHQEGLNCRSGGAESDENARNTFFNEHRGTYSRKLGRIASTTTLQNSPINGGDSADESIGR